MSNTTIIVGNIGQDPELTYTPSNNQARVTFSVGDTPSIKNKATGEWERGETDWVRCIAWGAEAENIARDFARGNRVVVLGSYKARKYEDKKTGEMRTARDLRVEEIGATSKYQTIGSITKQPFQNNNNGGGGNYNNGGNFNGAQQAPAQQTAPQPQNDWSNPVGLDSEAPF